MTCGNCGHQNPQEAKFCLECGNSLTVACPNCATTTPPGSKFCLECGTALTAQAVPATTAETAGSPSRAERRMVSVLFADLVGFTTFSESRDSEEVRAMVTGYFERSREIVERFSGTVDKFIGDAVMAWWGAVEAREDDAERAVRAALELVDMVTSWGEEIGVPGLALRAGVVTGETSVGPGGNAQGLLVGDLVNTASRLQSIAEPGTVVVGESTRNLVAGAVEFEALGEQKVKGKEIPVRPYRALRVVAQMGGRGRAEGIEPPFTGRQDELRLLKDQLHATGRDQRARLVSIVGDGGIGKSRLAWELRKYIDGIAEPIYWHHGRSPAYGEGIAFWSIGEMIRGRAGIAVESDDRAKSRMKLRTAAAENIPSEEERVWVEPRLAALLGLEDMPTGDRDELFSAIRTFFWRIAERGTAVMVFEDLHWADDGVLEFITDLVERSTRNPILVVTLSRPELLDRHPGWGSGRRNTLSMHLAPLPDDEMAQLVTGMVPGIPDAAAEAIVGRAAGIPLYAVEFVRMLLGSGDLVRDGDTFTLTGEVADLAVPDSLAAVIGARLDRLDPGDRTLVQDAAVLGQSFTLHGLAAIRGIEPQALEEPLRALVRQELFELDENPRSAERGQYRFVQSLIREVAYGRLSKEDRHRRHRAVADYFAGLDDPELAGVVASHYLSAHETAPPGTEDLLERGRTALLDAARRAANLQAHAAALALYRQALGLTTDAAGQAPILVDATEAAGWAGNVDESIDLGRRAIAAMEEIGDAEGRLRAYASLGNTLDSFLRADEGVALLRPVFESIDDFATVPRVRLGLEMSRAYMLNRQPEEAVEVAERVLPRAERLASPAEVIEGIISKATALVNLGRSLEAEATLAGLVALAEQHDLQKQVLRALNNLAVVQTSVDPMAALKTGEELVERTLKFSGSAWGDRAKGDRADQLIVLGRFDDALEMLDSLDFDHLPQMQQRLATVTRLVVDGYQDPHQGAGARLREEIESWGTITDPQAQEFTRWYRELSHLLDGDWDRVFEIGVELPLAWALEGALTAALRNREAGMIRRGLEAIESQIPASGRLGIALRKLASGALTVLDGNLPGGADTMAAGLEVLTKVGHPLDIADWQTAFASLVGLDHPAALEAATAAQAWLREVGALGLERVWADGLPGDVLAAERVG
jgi:class 3 adenylate cyclase/predicted ATPase